MAHPAEAHLAARCQAVVDNGHLKAVYRHTLWQPQNAAPAMPCALIEFESAEDEYDFGSRNHETLRYRVEVVDDIASRADLYELARLVDEHVTGQLGTFEGGAVALCFRESYSVRVEPWEAAPGAGRGKVRRHEGGSYKIVIRYDEP